MTAFKKTAALCAGLVLLFVLSLLFTGCGVNAHAVDLTEGVEAQTRESGEISEQTAVKATDFAVKLLKQSRENGKNTLLSPLSAFAALAVTANGAGGETRAQIEQVLGMDVAEMNEFFLAYSKSLPGNSVRLANSAWINKDAGLSVERDFLQTNADYYGADAFLTSFDNAMLNDVNAWVKEKTDGTIPKVLEEVPANAVFYLVNALSFEEKWMKEYKEDQVQSGIFTTESGEKQNVKFLCTEYEDDDQLFLNSGKATGFLKYYKGGKYAFAALLPKKGASLNDYIASLNGQSLRQVLSESICVNLKTGIPKFETEYAVDLPSVLKEMGMVSAFYPLSADFSGMFGRADGVFLGGVRQKTFLSVDEKGTKAGAATEAYSCVIGISSSSSVILDRPFVYMLVDTETLIPFFIGTVEDLGG